MILVLNGADFSADNLGQVEVTQNLNAYTEAAILASGNSAMTKVQKSALDSFFIALGVDGSNNLLSKMRKVYLPIIAADLSKSFVNYATNTFATDLTPSSEQWEISNHGVVRKNTTGTGALSLTLTTPVMTGNSSVFSLKTVLHTQGETSYFDRPFILRGKTDSTKFFGPSYAPFSSGNYYGFESYGYTTKTILAGDDQIKASCAMINTVGSETLCVIDGNVLNATLTNSVDMSGESQQTVYVLGLGDKSTKHPFAVLMLGEGMTAAQAQNICNKIDNLYTAFNV